MKISYDRHHDIILLELSSSAIDYAEKVGPIIVHFSKADKPVLLEILDASEVLSTIVKNSLRAKEEKLQPA
jgi:uncharacterized protein YuzE